MEPLLRWLHAGGQGYEYGCLNTDQQTSEQKAQNKISSGAFADDLICITGKHANLRIRAKKLTLYADRAHLIISGNKTKVTCSLPSPQSKELRGNMSMADYAKRQLQDKVL
eukprot:847337-Pelagomonas_calceolata.AAC.1